MTRRANVTKCAIAVVGMGCWYPGARNPRELWANVLSRRREFRRMPDGRLPQSAYFDADPATPDKTYGTRAALIDGFAFDWTRLRIPQKTVLGTDRAQWLALEVALQALADAGYMAREDVPRQRTGVLLGNTLTGEDSRAHALRLRWPYVKRALLTTLGAYPLDERERIAAAMENVYKSVFNPVTEDTLPGSLSNTIAGRICNFLDLRGGGYTVDAACASSLVAVCQAATALAQGDLDLALAGGVDVSLDSFELVSFAKTGALTPDEMRVYDRRGNGFIPGEGCGFVVLRRLEDALSDGQKIYAVLRGWGISSDGRGGITAPSRVGQTEALLRAYDAAGYDPRGVAFIEGHGTGTRVGDRTELEGIAEALAHHGDVEPKSCGVTSLKSLVGHTKAAAGIGAFLKTVMAVNRRVLPPTAGCEQPHPSFEGASRGLYPLLQGECRAPDSLLRAGVSAMGFGGINSHVTLESSNALPDVSLATELAERALLVSHQDVELFVVGASSAVELAERLEEHAADVVHASLAELTDLAAHLARSLASDAPWRAFVVAGDPENLAGRLVTLAQVVRAGGGQIHEAPDGMSGYGRVDAFAPPPRVGFVFPGQGSQQLLMGRTLVERYDWARDLVALANRCGQDAGRARPLSESIFRVIERSPDSGRVEEWKSELAQTETAQPALCLTSVLWLKYLVDVLGLAPTALAGHSLGELTAFHAAGFYDAETLLRLAFLRGNAMAAKDDEAGFMTSLACSAPLGEELVKAGSP